MPFIIKKRKDESSASFLNRSLQLIRKSGILLEVKKKQFATRKPNKRTKKLSALHRLKIISEIEKKKLGILK